MGKTQAARSSKAVGRKPAALSSSVVAKKPAARYSSVVAKKPAARSSSAVAKKPAASSSRVVVLANKKPAASSPHVVCKRPCSITAQEALMRALTPKPLARFPKEALGSDKLRTGELMIVKECLLDPPGPMYNMINFMDGPSHGKMTLLDPRCLVEKYMMAARETEKRISLQRLKRDEQPEPCFYVVLMVDWTTWLPDEDEDDDDVDYDGSVVKARFSRIMYKDEYVGHAAKANALSETGWVTTPVGALAYPGGGGGHKPSIGALTHPVGALTYPPPPPPSSSFLFLLLLLPPPPPLPEQEPETQSYSAADTQEHATSGVEPEEEADAPVGEDRGG